MSDKITTLELISNIHLHNINTKDREIYLHSIIDDSKEEIGVDYRMANIFIKNIRLLDSISHKPITIIINSDGGEWSYGMAIYDAIQLCQSYTITISLSAARSMSSIIPQAANKRLIYPNSNLVIHFGTIAISETQSVAASSNIRWNDTTTETMLDIYTNRCKNGQFFKEKKWNNTKIKEYLRKQIEHKGDWYLTAEESVYYGFMDAIIKNDKQSAI